MDCFFVLFFKLKSPSVFLCRTTPYSVYSPETYEGHWKQLTVRTTRTKQAMTMAFFHPQVSFRSPSPTV